MSFFDAFLGSTPSQFSAYAILAAVISIAISIILTGTDMTVGNRMLLILFVILAILPSVFLMLLQITCMVTGGNANERWWCWLYSWVIAVFVIVYCVFIVIISLSSLFTYNNAVSKVDMSDTKNKMTPESSNNYAKMMIESYKVGGYEEAFTNPEQPVEEPEDNISNNNSASIDGFINPKDVMSYVAGSNIKMPSFMSGSPDGFANLNNGSNMKPPKSPEVHSPSSVPPSVPSSVPSSASPSTPQSKSNEPFNSKEVITDEIEPFSNYNYASYH